MSFYNQENEQQDQASGEQCIELTTNTTTQSWFASNQKQIHIESLHMSTSSNLPGMGMPMSPI